MKVLYFIKKVFTITVEVKLPDDLLEFYSEKKLQNMNRLLIAIELYLDEKISIGKAAELSGIPFEEFVDELRKRKIKRLTGLKSISEIEKEFQDLKSFSKS